MGAERIRSVTDKCRVCLLCFVLNIIAHLVPLLSSPQPLSVFFLLLLN